MEKKKNPNKLSFLTKCGYGAGTAGDSMPYTLFFTYFIFFLTDVAGISPSIAGTISFVAIIWQGITGPIFGYLSDNSNNPKGRRRPMMFKALIPYVIFIALLFAPINLGGAAQWIFYLICAMGMWTCYSSYKGPWDALGAELSQDYKERNMIRFSVGLWAYPFNMIAQSGVMAVVAVFAAKGAVGRGWSFAAIMCAAVVLIFGLFCWKTTAGKESVDYQQKPAAETKRGVMDLFKQYGSILKIKAYRTLVIFMFIFVLGYTVAMNGITYLLTYNAGLSEANQSFFWVVNTVVCIVMLPGVTSLANIIDKKVSIIIFLIMLIIVNVIFFFTGVTGMASAIVLSCGMALGTSAFYGVFYSLIYDCCDVYELATGERREGGIMAVAQLAQTLGSAVASLLLGWLLTAFHYTGTGVETESTLRGLLAIETVIPAAIMVISLIFLFRYKMTKEKFQAVLQAIKDKKEGKTVDMEPFKDLI